jgi:DHA1 family bicyclomycin/chloramphenicol resistance-like MFS transporter
MSQPSSSSGVTPTLSFWELVALLVTMTGIVALSVDMMLPALSDIATELRAPQPNDRQYVVYVYLLGFGLAQLIYGPLADAYGRRPVILIALVLFLVMTLVCMIAQTFETMLVARLLQGTAAAACRVIAVAIARDLTSGRRMAEVMSMAMTVFMAVPVLAPGLGQLILFIGPWQWIFGSLFLIGAALVAWLYFRLPETLHPEHRIRLSFKTSTQAFTEAMTTRLTLGYTFAAAAFFAGLYAFLGSAEQIFAEHFELGDRFPIAFAVIAGGMGITSYANSRLVSRWGQRRLSHGALIGFITISASHALILFLGIDSLPVFLVFLGASTALLGLIAANFSALAMEPVGHIAGTASAAYGFVTGVVGTLIGVGIGQMYDGTPIPLIVGQSAMGVLTLGCVWWTEKGRLFEVGESDGVPTD